MVKPSKPLAKAAVNTLDLLVLCAAMAPGVYYMAQKTVEYPEYSWKGFIWWFLLALAVIGFPALVSFAVRGRWWKAPFALLALATACYYFVNPWHPRQVFVRTLESIHPGMSAEAACKRMLAYAPRGQVDDSMPGFITVSYTWSDDPQFARDVASFEVRNDRVSSTEFSPN